MRHTLLLHHGIPARNLSVVILVLGPLLWLPCLWAASPITPSGLHTQVSDPITLPANHIQYDITGGTRPGGAGGTNLFHSFGDFSVPTNNIANFLNAGSVDLNGNVLAPNLPTSNILGRVTGVDPSAIFGTIQTNGTGGFGNANLFLMNPHGFLFGPNATVNVGGMMTFTTADYLRFQGTDTLFNKVSTPESLNLLSTVPVAAFGFLGSNPAAIAIQGSTLQVAQGQSLSFLGGNEGFKYIDPDTGIRSSTTVSDGVTMTEGTLLAPGGQVNIASVASPGEILVGTLAQAANINGQTFGALGSIQVSQRSNIDVSGDGGGTVLIRGGQFVLDNSTISANVTDSGPIIAGVESIGHGIDIVVRQDAVIQNGAILQTNVMGNASPSVQYSGVHVKADRIEILGSQDFENFPVTGIFSSVAQDNTGGSSGDIKLEANSILVREFGTFTTFLEAGTDGAGNSGNILMKARGNLEMDGVVFVDTFSGDSASGNAGSIEFTSTRGNILLTNGPNVYSQNGVFSSGSVGSIAVNAPNGDIHLTGSPDFISSAIYTHIDGIGPNAGKGGIQLSAKNLIIENSGIQIDNFTHFQPGDLTVNLTGKLSLSGADSPSTLLTTTRRSAQSADLNITAPDIILADGSRVSTETYRDGDGGTLNIFTQHLKLTSKAQITSGSIFNPNLFTGDPLETPSGAGGTITIQGLQSPAESVLIDGAGSGILTDTEGTGAGGSIFVNANSVTLQNGGTLSVATSGTAPTARGGTITVEGNRVQLNSAATITAATSGPANAGEVLVRSDTFSINEGATISAQSTGSGNAGNVTIQGHASPADSAVISGFDENFNPSGIFTDTQATGAGGNIHISAKSIALQDSGTLSATTSGTASTATGGAIMIDAETLSMDGATITAETGADNSGRAGNVTISAKTIETANFSFITTVSKGIGQAGDISLKATDRISLIDSFVNSDTFPSLTSTKAGDGGLIHLHAPMIDLQSTLLGAVTTGAGNAGNLLLEAQQLNIQASEFGKPFNTGSELKAQTQSSGNAGAITIRGLGGEGSSADIVTLTDASRLSSRTSDTGDAGNISIAAAQLTLSEGANLSSSTESGIGTGGSINLFAESFTMQTGGTLLATTSGTDTTATGGSITVKATDQVIMTSGASITANSTGPGDAGNISIKAGQQFEMRDSSITTTATKASGGNIDIQAVNRVHLVNSPISASVADGRGGGGNISIDPQFVILQNSQILAKAADGQGGAITITTNLFLPDANSIVNADANPGSGVNGTVTIQSPNAPASGHIQPLDKSPLQATSLLNQRCAALAGGEFSSFTVAGRDSLPTEPGSWLASPLTIGLTKTGDTLTEKGGGHAGINDITDEPAQLSLRQIAPAGFLTQVFAVDLSAGCTS